MKWYKGTLHCHTSRSDGKATPLQVGQFYRMQGHNFLGVADHNRFTPPEEYANHVGLEGIPCCEYSGEACCHVVAVGVTESIAPTMIKRRKPRSHTAILQEGIDKTIAAGGVPVVCHPHWNWTLSANDISALKNCRHFEICNAGPDCNAHPVPGYEPGDNLWDELLTAGHRYYGLASDDAHDYFYPPTPRSPRGGTGFNVVRVPGLTKDNVIKAIRYGHFYASTGVILQDYRVTRKGISLKILNQTNERTVIQFFGSTGKELKCIQALDASYTFKGDEIYVRIRIGSTAGLWAWTQPVFLDDLNDAIRWTGKK